MGVSGETRRPTLEVKVVLVIGIVMAHECFLLNCGLLALVATSLIAMIIVTFLHSFSPTLLNLSFSKVTDGLQPGAVEKIIYKAEMKRL